MKRKQHILFLVASAAVFLSNKELRAQASSFDAVYNIFQSNCISCHSSTTKQGQLDLSGTAGEVYKNIFNVEAVNPAAKAKGDKLVAPGDPRRSFLLRKCNNGLDPYNDIVPAEGVLMPKNAAPLKKNEIEIIRQWIIYGAKQSGKQFDTSLVNDYYRGKGVNETVDINQLPPPPAGEGFQMYFGPVFLPKKSETEWFIKYETKFPDSMDITRLNMKMTNKSHHYIIYKFKPGTSSTKPDGLRVENGTGVTLNQQLVNSWGFPKDAVLPAGTVFRWEKNTVLDQNFHLKNTHDSVVMADVRINVYTEKPKSASRILYSDLIENIFINIPNDNKPHTFLAEVYDKNAARMWDVWMFSSHTHKYGVDYDIYKRNPASPKDTSYVNQLYEGHYDTEYNFNQGYYDWAHPAVKRYSSPLPVNPRNGLIHVARFINNGPKAVGFGFTTNDEMMLLYVQYTLGASLLTGTGDDKASPNIRLRTYPNPYKDVSRIVYSLDKRAAVQVEIYNMLGEKVRVLADEIQVRGNYEYPFHAGEGHSRGMYLVKVTVDGIPFSQRIIRTE